MSKKKIPYTYAIGYLYSIWIAPFKQGYRKTEKLIWEGYGDDNPWKAFNDLALTHLEDCVTLYVEKYNVLNELAQYWDGEILISE